MAVVPHLYAYLGHPSSGRDSYALNVCWPIVSFNSQDTPQPSLQPNLTTRVSINTQDTLQPSLQPNVTATPPDT